MNIHAINVIARYEVKLLKRSWLFRIFAVLALFILTIAQLSNFTPLEIRGNLELCRGNFPDSFFYGLPI